MTTAFSLLLSLSSLSHREAAELLCVRIDTIKSWSSGRNRCPDGALADMRDLIVKQERSAAEGLSQIARLAAEDRAPDLVELGEPIDDDDAQSMGWPCVGAWRGMAARVVADAAVPVSIVPRGRTTATKAAKEIKKAH